MAARRPRRRSPQRLAISALLAGGLVLVGTWAAFTDLTLNGGNAMAAGTVVLLDDDGGTPSFDIDGSQPGDRGARCIKLTYPGTVQADVRLVATATGGAMAPYVALGVVEGTGGSFASCAGFAPHTLGYRGTIADLPTTYGTGAAGSFAPAAANLTRTYKIVYEIDPATPGAALADPATVDLRWEARSATHTPAMAFGYNGEGNLGTGDFAGHDTPTPIGAASDDDWASLSANGDSSCAIKAAGTLHCWGENSVGELGLGDFTNRGAPEQVGADADWASVSLGADHGCAVKASGALYCWGANANGELGVGDDDERLVPTQVGVATDWASVAGGSEFTCAIRTTGALYCWGRNLVGQLGLGDTTERLSPAQVGSDTDWSGLATANEHACATRSGGQLYCWGVNDQGQLGLGDLANRDVPTRVGTGVAWATVAAARNGACAITTAGTLHCWGENDDLQLGLGDTADRDVPTQVGSDDDWATAAVGYYHGCATKADGALYCWGENGAGELGLGDRVNRSSPTLVGSGYRDVAAGWGHTLTLRRPTP